jgi:hypothetical protein
MATAVILQSGEVPSGLTVCLGSGPIDVYLASLAQADATIAARAADQWQQMRALGARDGAISLFTANPSACKAELGATSNARAMVSFVARLPTQARPIVRGRQACSASRRRLPM